MSKFLTAALYKFVALPDFVELQAPLLSCCENNKVKGTLLLAEEGINGTISGSPEGIHTVLTYLRSDPIFANRLADLVHKESYAEKMPFYRMKVRLKREIVTLGVPGVDPNKMAGTYVKPEDWNALISDPDVILVDTRNDYEVSIGTFKGAINPRTTNFRDFEEVYHLQGGILKYLEEVPKEQSLWKGECFVFDERVSVDHDLKPGQYEMCRACRHPLSTEDRKSEFFELGVSCPHCHGQKTEERKKAYAERQRQVELADSRNQAHIGARFEPRKKEPLQKQDDAVD